MDEKNEILIIDDDEGTRKTLTLILKKKGFDVISAGTGQEGLELAKGRRISIALLDINLPDIEGIRLIAPLKGMHPNLTVIMITGFASMENAMRALNEGATGYVLKPIKIEEILVKIHDAFERQNLIKNKQQAEEALRLSEEKYRNLVENINDVIFLLDEKGIITYLSPAVEKITGYTPSQITGQPFTGFILKDDLSGVIQTFEAARKGKITSFPFRILTKYGDQRWLNSSS
ncbi:MAG: response regulator, partial [Methanoregula sp.]|nr:response regulator [Methanoregula sp.]